MKLRKVWVVARKGIPGVHDSEATMVVSREYNSRELASVGLDRVQRADHTNTEFWLETRYVSDWKRDDG